MLIVLTKILLSASPRTPDLRPCPLLSKSPSLLPLPLLPRLRRPLLLGLFPSLCITLSEAPAADQIICRFCHKPGHYARNCPERPPRPERREGWAYYCMLKRRARPRRFRRLPLPAAGPFSARLPERDRVQPLRAARTQGARVQE